MSVDLSKCIFRYRRLRDEIDREIGRLEVIHADHLVCREKCINCCVNLTVLPVEFFAIKDELNDLIGQLKFDTTASCGFLAAGLCSIYHVRPLICRTHGLAIAFLNDSLEYPEYSVSFCPMNFASQGAEDLQFSAENVLNIDDMNEELFEINLDFVNALGRPDITAYARMNLSDLFL